MVHPDLVECERKLALNTFKNNLTYFTLNSATRFYVENMPGKNFLGYEAEEIIEILKSTNAELCLDTEHLYTATNGNKTEIKRFVKRLSEKIKYAHVCGIGHGSLDEEIKPLIKMLRNTPCEKIALEVFTSDAKTLIDSKKKLIRWLHG